MYVRTSWECQINAYQLWDEAEASPFAGRSLSCQLFVLGFFPATGKIAFLDRCPGWLSGWHGKKGC